MATTITPARTADDIATARSLMREYHAWVGGDVCFQGFEAELRDLPGAYAPPRGCLLLARSESGDEVGCVAMRDLGEGRCEMKRLFVRPSARGHGIGRHLVDAVLREARELGYDEMVLDTLPSMADAQRMYLRLGFRDVAPHGDGPGASVRHLGLRLGA